MVRLEKIHMEIRNNKMRITKQQLKQIIKEELEAVLSDSLSEAAANYQGDSIMVGKVKVYMTSKSSGGSKSIFVIRAEYGGKDLFTHDVGYCDEFKGCGPLAQSYKKMGPQDLLQMARKSGADLETMKLLKKLLA